MIGQIVFMLSLCLYAQAWASKSVTDEYLSAFERALNNRALAADVVATLAQYHEDTAQGRFWAAYVELERQQWPIYRKYAKCYGSSVNGFTVWIKARASTVFAWLFPDKFISMLADSTHSYAEALKQTPVPDNPRDQRFWDYVLAQERAQVRVFNHAEKGEFTDAAEELSSFTSSHIPSREWLSGG